MNLVEADGFITVFPQWPERPECDFSSPPLTQCAYCLKTIRQVNAHVALDGEHFCNEEEAETYRYLLWLRDTRRAGL